jgi:hypothetical protein
MCFLFVVDCYVTWKALAWPHHFAKMWAWAHKTSLIPPPYFKVLVPSQESERSCICMLRLSISSLSTVLIFDFGTVPTVWYFGIVPTVWYFGIVPTVWYFGIVPTVWYFGIVPTV